MLALACRQSRRTNAHGDVGRALADNECERALALLAAVDVPGRGSDWYLWSGQAHAQCYLSGQGEGEKRLAIEALDEGIRLYPRAAALTMWKGAVTMQFGELALGRRYKADALRIARENLDQGIGNPRENFEVVEALSREQQGKPPPTP